MVTPADSSERELHSPRAWIVAALIALGPYLLLAWRFDWLCDDAFISFRYSRHLAEGHGLVFNLGETPPVEGYSNFLWVLALAPFEAVGLDLSLAARAISVACGAVLLALVARAVQRRFAPRPLETAACALFFAALPAVSIWATSGLESMAFALALFGLFERLDAGVRRTAAVWGALAVLLRADGALWAAAVIGAYAALPPRDVTARVRSWALPAIAVIAVAAVQTAWRYAYYGELLPNTAFAKAAFSELRLERGWSYVVSFAFTLPACVLLPIAALALPAARRHACVPRAALLVLFAACYAVWTGGDFMPMGRFLLPVMALEALLLGAVLAALRASRTAQVAVWVAALALSVPAAFDLHAVPRSVRERFHFRWSNSELLSEAGQWSTMRERFDRWDALARALALFTEPGQSLVCGAVGAVGYRTELVLHDQLGLTSPEVARRAVEPRRASPGHDLRVPAEYFIALEPDYIEAFVADADTPQDAGIRPEWRRAPWWARASLVRHPLDPSRGFAPAQELRLVALDWRH